jgi:hypothetical protein
MSIEAMKMALEALKEINKLSIGESAICLPAEIDAAMDALRQELAMSKPSTKIFGPSLEEILNSAGFYRKRDLTCVCGAVWEGETMVHAPHHRKPLTHPQIHELDWPDGVAFDEILLFVRAIEAAHGIGDAA